MHGTEVAFDYDKCWLWVCALAETSWRSLLTIYTHNFCSCVKYILFVEKKKLYVEVSVRSRLFWWCCSADLSDSQHTCKPPVTSSALTWHVKSLLKPPRCTAAPAHLSFGARCKITHLFAHVHSHNKSTQGCFNILPTMYAVTCLSHSYTPHSTVYPFFIFSQSHANTLTRSISSDWIDGPRAFCWLRCCQIWWVIGKLCFAVTPAKLVIHFVNRDL